jgi:hypothetical protein
VYGKVNSSTRLNVWDNPATYKFIHRWENHVTNS